MGCRSLGLQPDTEPLDLKQLCRQAPVHTSTFFQWHGVCCPDLIAQMAQQADNTVRGVCQWLNTTPPVQPACLLILSDKEPAGRTWLKSMDRHESVGGMHHHQDNILVVIGDPNHSRFWTVLRHEAAHYALQATLKPDQALPFWLDEGTACLFETGIDQDYRPKPNPERLKALRYLIETRSSLHLRNVVGKPDLAPANGMHYARAWAVTAYLFHKQRSPTPYLVELQNETNPGIALFEKTLLGPNESITDFEAHVKDWITP